MTREEFKAKLTEKFDLQDGVFEKDGYRLVFRHGAYTSEWDDDAIEFQGFSHDPDNVIEVQVDMLGDAVGEDEVWDKERHFDAAAVLLYNGEPFVHIAEPGDYQDHIFINYHDEGLYSLEDLDEDYTPDTVDEVEYEEMARDKRIEQLPFFENLLARNLQELFDHIVEVERD